MASGIHDEPLCRNPYCCTVAGECCGLAGKWQCTRVFSSTGYSLSLTCPVRNKVERKSGKSQPKSSGLVAEDLVFFMEGMEEVVESIGFEIL